MFLSACLVSVNFRLGLVSRPSGQLARFFSKSELQIFWRYCDPTKIPYDSLVTWNMREQKISIVDARLVTVKLSICSDRYLCARARYAFGIGPQSDRMCVGRASGRIRTTEFHISRSGRLTNPHYWAPNFARYHCAPRATVWLRLVIENTSARDRPLIAPKDQTTNPRMLALARLRTFFYLLSLPLCWRKKTQ